MKKSFLTYYLFFISFLFSCAAIEIKEDIFSKKGKFSFASNSEYFSGTINVSDEEKRIQLNLDSLSKDFKISFKGEEIKTNFKYKNIIKDQINAWSIEKIKNLIFEINIIELQIKKNSYNAINFTTNFLLEKSN